MAKSTKEKSLLDQEYGCSKHCMLYIGRLPINSQRAVLEHLGRAVQENVHKHQEEMVREKEAQYKAMQERVKPEENSAHRDVQPAGSFAAGGFAD